jgi:hypothetical protein
LPLHADHLLTAAVNLSHFRLLRVVGKGAFGKVRIVERKDNCDQFALKYIRKDEGMMVETSVSLRGLGTGFADAV